MKDYYKIKTATMYGIMNTPKHQKKVIDRLSRRIQRLKGIDKINQERIRQLTYIKKLYVRSLHKHLEKDERINKAIHYIEDNLSWAKGSEELLEILKGSDNNV